MILFWISLILVIAPSWSMRAQYQVVNTNGPTLLYGTAPRWNSDLLSVFYLDIDAAYPDNFIFRYDYQSGVTYGVTIPYQASPAFMFPIANETNLYAVGLNTSLAIMSWDGVSPQASIVGTIFDFGPLWYAWDRGGLDPLGRFYGGGYGDGFCTAPRNQTFVRWDKYRGISRLLNITGFGGITWDTTRNKVYYFDECRPRIQRYDWYPETGKLCNGRNVYYFTPPGTRTPYDVVPLGLTIDTKGMLYTAIFNRSAVYKIDPDTSRVVSIFDLPTQLVSGVTFVGPNLDELFVVSVGAPETIYGTDPLNQQVSSSAGQSFLIRNVGATGMKQGASLNV